jgi:hypothetical protein
MRDKFLQNISIKNKSANWSENYKEEGFTNDARKKVKSKEEKRESSVSKKYGYLGIIECVCVCVYIGIIGGLF